MNNPTKLQFKSQLGILVALVLVLTQNVQGQTANQFKANDSTLNLSAPAVKNNFNPIPFKLSGATQSPGMRQAKSNTAVPVTQGSFKTIQPNQNSTTPKPNQFAPPQETFSKPRLGSTPAEKSSFGSTQLPGKATPSAQSTGSSRLPDSIECSVSSVHFIDDIRLPAIEAGEIKTLNFKEGDFVPAGQTIGLINDEVYQMMLEQAEMRYQIALDIADDETASLAARKKYQVASIEAQRIDKLAASGSKSPSDKLMANYTKEIAYLDMRKADRERRKALAEAKLALAEKRQVQTKIARHTLKSDFDAYVVQIFKKEQEYVQTGEEVMRLARMDRLWVQSVVSYRELNAHELKNRKVTITVPLARDQSTTFEGVIKFVGLERQGPELMMVKAEVVNRPVNGHWVLHPEAEVKMTIHLNDSPSTFGTASKENVKR